MGQVIVRNLDDQVLKALKARARLTGHSLEQELRDILTEASRLNAEEKLRLIDQIRAMSGGPYSDDSVTLIRQDRDRR